MVGYRRKLPYGGEAGGTWRFLVQHVFDRLSTRPCFHCLAQTPGTVSALEAILDSPELRGHVVRDGAKALLKTQEAVRAFFAFELLGGSATGWGEAKQIKKTKELLVVLPPVTLRVGIWKGVDMIQLFFNWCYVTNSGEVTLPAILRHSARGRPRLDADGNRVPPKPRKGSPYWPPKGYKLDDLRAEAKMVPMEWALTSSKAVSFKTRMLDKLYSVLEKEGLKWWNDDGSTADAEDVIAEWHEQHAKK